MLGHAPSGELLALRRLSFGPRTAIKLAFALPPGAPPPQSLDLLLVSDCYLGLDQQHSVSLLQGGSGSGGGATSTTTTSSSSSARGGALLEQVWCGSGSEAGGGRAGPRRQQQDQAAAGWGEQHQQWEGETARCAPGGPDGVEEAEGYWD